MKYAFSEVLADMGKWFIVGVVLAGIIAALLPDGFIEEYLGRGPVSMLVMLLVSMPMYVCATSSTPIAAALVLKGLSPGAALVFLLAGPATNAASLAMVSRILGLRGAAVYLAAIAACSLGLGFLADVIYSGTAVADLTAWTGRARDSAIDPISILSAVLLLVLIAWSYFRARSRGTCRAPEPKTKSTPPAGKA